MVNDVELPVQVTPALVYEGVTVMEAETGAVAVFVARKEAISPVPLAGRPMEVFEFVQL